MNIPPPLQPFLDMKSIEAIDRVVSDLDSDAMYDLLELLDVRRALDRTPDPPAGRGGYQDPTSPEGIELQDYLKGVLKEFPLADRDRLLLFLHFAVRDQVVPGLDLERIGRLADLVRRFHPQRGGGAPEGEDPVGGDPSMN